MEKEVTRERVLAYASEWSGIPVDQLKDDTIVGDIGGRLRGLCCFHFSMPVLVIDPKTFTFGQLISQLVY